MKKSIPERNEMYETLRKHISDSRDLTSCQNQGHNLSATPKEKTVSGPYGVDRWSSEVSGQKSKKHIVQLHTDL